MLVDAEQNRQSAQKKLDIPVPALDVTGHVFDVGHDLADEVPDEVADVVPPFLAEQL
ncbi:hypothetical protein GCM10010317_039450 [Streptomyces mirabilis]|nr:hypothetical protein GCM10010317_039450 [Streptomyces mirabilis]